MNHYPKTGSGRREYLHRLRAERALGKPLPPGAVVHHADGSKDEHAPLVICQDAAYHYLLHMRQRVVQRGGNPSTDKWCPDCKSLKLKTDFNQNSRKNDGLHNLCRLCVSARMARYLDRGNELRRVRRAPPAEGANA